MSRAGCSPLNIAENRAVTMTRGFRNAQVRVALKLGNELPLEVSPLNTCAGATAGTPPLLR